MSPFEKSQAKCCGYAVIIQEAKKLMERSIILQ
jgi:hypothetical protein